MSWMAIKHITLALIFVVVSPDADTQEDACVVDVDRDIARNILEHSRVVMLGELKLPIPRELASLEFQVSDDRGQFAFRKNNSSAESSNPEQSSAEEAGNSGLYSIVFTTEVEVSSESEVFFVAEKCSLGEILVSYIRMEGMADQSDAGQTLILDFPGSTSVLIYGRDYDLYLGMLQQINR
ncbi:MAG: hypothetical protein RQ847_07835 [Wenzhouxiangellaceae bacterium]|nr:hypothetical protein [Wenzhouxiangellaceae bacterium]